MRLRRSQSDLLAVVAVAATSTACGQSLGVLSGPPDGSALDGVARHDSTGGGRDSGGRLGHDAGRDVHSSRPDSGRDSGGGRDAEQHGCGSCPVGQYCSDGGCACPAYQSLCHGACVPTTDPNNCGGCGVVCAGSTACSAGACVSADAGCLSGLSPCDHACVDTLDDSANCGGCGAKCEAGTGCAGGKCAPSLDEKDAGTLGCAAGGGVATQLGADAGCAGGLAEITFRWALCSCTNLDVSAPLTTEGFNSTKGPPGDGGLGGSVGCNDAILNWSSSVSIGGDLWAADAGQFKPSGAGSVVRNDLHLGGSVAASSPFTVDDNAYVTGTVSGVTVNGATSHPTSIAAPCDCAPSQLVPVGAIVAAHASPNNDNAAIGVDPSVVAAGGGPLRIDLPCGNFYFTAISTNNPLTIWAHGHTAIYIQGDVTASSQLSFQLDPTATLDLFVSGTLTTSQILTIGSPNYPALCRAYIGGATPLQLSSTANIGCNFYAAEAALQWSASNAIYGAVFAGDFKESHNTTIYYDLAVLSAESECHGSGGYDGGAGSGGDASGEHGGSGDSGAPACQSCRDCSNQACNGGHCGACATSADCCAPLECSGGTCGPVVMPK